MDLTTTAKVKSYLGVTSTTYDTLLADLITSISAQVETFCGRQFSRGTFTEYYDTNGETKIFLPNYPVVSVTSVKYQNGAWGNITWTTLPTSSYLLNTVMGKISFIAPLPEAESFLEVIYVGGYLIDFTAPTDPLKHTLPTDLTLAVTQLVAQAFTQRQAQGIGSMSTEGQSITYKAVDQSPDFTKRLASYINYK